MGTMEPRNNLFRALAVALIAGSLLLATGPASAVYVERPLRLDSHDVEFEVGDTAHFTVRAENETTAAEWAGRTVSVHYAYDANEGDEQSTHNDPDASTDNSGWTQKVLLESLALDQNAEAAFEWIVPEEVDDRNVNILLLDDEGEVLALLHVAVGDATPMMYTTGAPDDGREIDTGNQGEPEPAADSEDDTVRESPMPGALVAVALAGAAVVVARRR